MISLKRKFEKQPSLKSKDLKIIHASKLPHQATKHEQNEIINYIPLQAVTNIKKVEKTRVVFDAGARYENKFLDEKLYNGLN